MMHTDVSFRRRAIYTGLRPFMPEEQLMEALLLWQDNFATAPRFTLQKFVAELCHDNALRSRRADILLSLVQAMNMPGASLLPDPLASRSGTHAVADEDTLLGSAAAALLEAILTLSAGDNRYQLRLDLLASLDGSRLPQDVFQRVQRWLVDNSPLDGLTGERRILRAVVNQVYVALCQRAGPVETDRVLAAAVDEACAKHPELGEQITSLL